IREMALKAAETIMLEKGKDGLSARKIAQEIGYTVGTLYLIFKNLDDLILHVNGRTLERLYEKLSSQQQSSSDSKTALLQLAKTYINFAGNESNRWKVVFEHRAQTDNTTPEWYQERVGKMFTAVETHLSRLAPHKSPSEIKDAARALWGGVHGICMLALTDNLDITGVESADTLTQSLINNYLAGFTAG
ncbi:MAG: TetR/AcrR family transcriptional regulator, partial [Gammaproteobacteria bacterium]|nr:TetR/AcrR family transcriptional regulator [Gammaproteobacteria bacterium]